MNLSELNESASQFRNQHLEHIEDLILEKGEEGAKDALETLNEVVGLLSTATPNTSGHAKISCKWDGSPAIICGIDPEDKKFFVGTKAVFSKEPKVIKSAADVKKFYGTQPELAHKLEQCFKYLSKLNISGVMQGDLLFTEDSIKRETIEDQHLYTFTPNTVTYGVPVGSKLGATVKRAKVGIVFHTKYHGKSLDTMHASMGAGISGLSHTNDVWVHNPTYTDLSASQLTYHEYRSVKDDIETIEKLLDSLTGGSIEKFLAIKFCKTYLKMWVNDKVKLGEHIEVKTAANEFYSFVAKREQKEIGALKTEGAKTRRSDALEEFKRQLVTQRTVFDTIIRVHNLLTRVKNRLLARLNGLEHIGTFIKMDDGYKVTNHEGFVAIGSTGKAVKLVDRLTFSHHNFNKSRIWHKR